MMMIGIIGVTGNNNKASEPGTSTFNCSRFGVVLSRLAVLKKIWRYFANCGKGSSYGPRPKPPKSLGREVRIKLDS